MKTPELLRPHETRAALHELLAAGYVLHGSPVRDLDTLRATVTSFLYLDSHGNPIPEETRLCATEDPDYAIFFAAAHGVARDERAAKGIPRAVLGSSMTPVLDPVNGRTTGFRYWASPGTKDLVKAREASGVSSAVYYLSPDGFTYRKEGREWISPIDVRVIGSLAVSVDCLSFDYYQLPDPASDPRIREYNERADAEAAAAGLLRL